MESNGWVFSAGYKFNNWRQGWMGSSHSGGVEFDPSGWLEISLIGYGSAVVDYSSGYNGKVDLLLNGESKDQISGDRAQNVATIPFKEGDVLRIAEGTDGNPGVLVLNSITLNCNDLATTNSSINITEL